MRSTTNTNMQKLLKAERGLTHTKKNFSKRVTRGNKNEGREFNKPSNVADQYSNKPSSFVGKEKDRKLMKRKVYKSKGRAVVTQLLTYK